MKTSILTNTEKQELIDSGHSRADIQFICSAIRHTTYALVSQDGEQLTITEEEAIRRLGRHEWVRGVARSAFYINTTRNGLNGERIRLHSKTYDR